MIGADQFVAAARQRGFRLYTGVPCSYLKPFINYVIDDAALRYVPAANEAEAVAIAAGSELAGEPAIAMFQNSGLGNAVNPLTSLNETLRLGALLIVTLRGEPGGRPDAPQHEFMGEITTRLLELLRIEWEYFPDDDAQIGPALDRAVATIRQGRRPYALVMRHGTVAPWPLGSQPVIRPPVAATLPAAAAATTTRGAMLAAAQQAAGERDVLITTTGYVTREMYATGDRENQFYLIGAMGCASTFGLGLALAKPQRRVIVLDGDGAALMHLGALTTIGYERPGNLVHVVLDNHAHESTGGQATVSHSVDFCALAIDCGYEHVIRAATPQALAAALSAPSAGLTFIHVPILAGAPAKLPRPKMPPPALVDRLRAFLAR